MTALISTLQSRIAKRGVLISEMELDYDMARFVASFQESKGETPTKARKRSYAIRDTIKPLAIEQKVDRDLMRRLQHLEWYAGHQRRVISALSQAAFVIIG